MPKVAEYYELWFGENPDGMMCTRGELRGISEYFIYETTPIEHWPSDVTFFAEGKVAEDYLFPTTVGWIIVSARVREVFEEIEVEDVAFLPLRVIHEETGEELLGYSVLHVLCVISAMDRTHSVFDDTSVPGMFNIFKLALRRRDIGNTDVFRLKERPVSTLVSRRVVERLEAIRATGFRWIPVPCY